MKLFFFPAASLQWEKIRKSGKLPHLTRWFDFLSQTSPLKGLLEKHAPKKSAAAERVKEAAAAAKGSTKGATGSLGYLLATSQLSSICMHLS